MSEQSYLLKTLKALVTAYEDDVREDADLLCVSCGHTSSSHEYEVCFCGECPEYISPRLAIENAHDAIEEAEVPA